MLLTDLLRSLTPKKKAKNTFRDTDNTDIMEQLKSIFEKDVDVPIIDNDNKTEILKETYSNNSEHVENDDMNDNEVE